MTIFKTISALPCLMSSFSPHCCHCMAPLSPDEGRVSSCSCFLCSGCECLLLESPTKRCPSCAKERVKSISLSVGQMPDEVSNSLCNITDKLESFHETLIFQVKHYKRALNFAFNAMNDLKNNVKQRDEELVAKNQELNHLRSQMGRNSGSMMISDGSSSNSYAPPINAPPKNNNFFEDSNQEEHSSSSFSSMSQSSVPGRPVLMNRDSTSPGSSDQGGYKASSVSSITLSPPDRNTTTVEQSQKSSTAHHSSDRNRTGRLEIPNPALTMPTTLSGYEISATTSTGPVTSRLEDVGIRKRNRSPRSDTELRQRSHSSQPRQMIGGVGGTGRAGIGILKPPGSGSYGERGSSPVLRSDLRMNERSKGKPRTPSSSYGNRVPSPSMRSANHQSRPNTSLGISRVGPLGNSSIRSPHPPHLPLKGSKSATMTKEDLIQLQRDEIRERDKASNIQTFQRFQDID